MKSLDDDINDRIKKRLQDALGDFEVQPGRTVDKKIYSLLGQNSFPKGTLFLLGLVGLFCFLISGVAVVSNNLNSSKQPALTTNKSVKAKSERKVLVAKSAINIHDQDGLSDGTVEAPQTLVKKVVASERLKTVEANSIAINQNLPELVLSEAPHKEIISNRKLDVKSVSDQKIAVQLTEDKGIESNEASLLKNTTEIRGNRSNPDRAIIQNAISELAPERSVAESSLSNQLDENELDLSQIERTRYQVAELSPIQSVNPSGFASIPDVKIPVGSQLLNANGKPRRSFYIDWAEAKKISFVASITPIKTFQKVDVRYKEGSRIQDVAFPKEFSSFGYKAGIGLEKDGFQILANFSRLSGNVTYEYASDEYTVIPVESNKFIIKREGMTEGFQKPINMIGIGIKQQLNFNTKSLGGLFANAGLEYTKSLGRQSGRFLFASFSAGKRFIFSPKAHLFIGPYVDLSLSKMSTANGQIHIRPTQLGISFQLKLSSGK